MVNNNTGISQGDIVFIIDNFTNSGSWYIKLKIGDSTRYYLLSGNSEPSILSSLIDSATNEEYYVKYHLRGEDVAKCIKFVEPSNLDNYRSDKKVRDLLKQVDIAEIKIEQNLDKINELEESNIRLENRIKNLEEEIEVARMKILK